MEVRQLVMFLVAADIKVPDASGVARRVEQAWWGTGTAVRGFADLPGCGGGPRLETLRIFVHALELRILCVQLR